MKKFLLTIGLSTLLMFAGVNQGKAKDLDNGVCKDTFAEAKEVKEENPSTFVFASEIEDGEEFKFVILPNTKIYSGIDTIEGNQYRSVWAITTNGDGTITCHVQTDLRVEEIATIE